MRKKNIFCLPFLLAVAISHPTEASPSSLLTTLIAGVCAFSSAQTLPSRRLLSQEPIWSASKGDLYRVGNITQLNEVSQHSQEAPALCKLIDGGIASTWQSYGWDTDLWAVSLRIFTDELQPITDEILVNTHIIGNQLAPSIVCKAGGDLEVWWVSSGQDGDGDGIYRQCFNATGGRIGGEERVNTVTTGDQSSPRVAARKTGGTVGVFESNAGNGYDIYTRFYHANGSAEGVEKRINNYTTNYQRRPATIVLENGHILYLWETEQIGSGNDIHACIYTDKGVLFQPEFVINNHTDNDQRFSKACPLSSGFVAGWSSLLQDTSGFGVYVGRYDNAGKRMSGDVRVSTQTDGTQSWIALSCLPDIGIFLATWTAPDGSSYGIYGQLLTENLEFIGEEFLINKVTAGAQSDSTNIHIAGRTMLAAFQSNDGDSYGIFAQRLALLTPAPTVLPTTLPSLPPSLSPTENPSVSPTSNPTYFPSLPPSLSPTPFPSLSPTQNPSVSPTRHPTSLPSDTPTDAPSITPSTSPTWLPSLPPTQNPSDSPLPSPTNHPSTHPSPLPSWGSTLSPTYTPKELTQTTKITHVVITQDGTQAKLLIIIYISVGCSIALICLFACYCMYRDYHRNLKQKPVNSRRPQLQPIPSISIPASARITPPKHVQLSPINDSVSYIPSAPLPVMNPHVYSNSIHKKRNKRARKTPTQQRQAASFDHIDYDALAQSGQSPIPSSHIIAFQPPGYYASPLQLANQWSHPYTHINPQLPPHSFPMTYQLALQQQLTPMPNEYQAGGDDSDEDVISPDGQKEALQRKRTYQEEEDEKAETDNEVMTAKTRRKDSMSELVNLCLDIHRKNLKQQETSEQESNEQESQRDLTDDIEGSSAD